MQFSRKSEVSFGREMRDRKKGINASGTGKVFGSLRADYIISLEGNRNGAIEYMR